MFITQRRPLAALDTPVKSLSVSSAYLQEAVTDALFDGLVMIGGLYTPYSLLIWIVLRDLN